MSFPRYEKYKDSGVEWLGEVPEGWEVTPIKLIGRLKGGAGFPHGEQGVEGEELSFHKVNALGQANGDGVLLPSENTISRETASRLGAFIFPPKAIVFAKVGAALLLGRIRTISEAACLDNNMMGLVVNEESHVVNFIRYAMDLVRFDLIANPGAVPSLNEAQIGNFHLVIPQKTEQRAIAAFLDHETGKIDALVAEQEKLIGLLKEKRQAVISHAVTKGLDPNARMKDSGVEWLGEVPEGWEVVRVKHTLKHIGSGGTPDTEQTLFWSDNEEGIPWVAIGDMSDRDFIESTAKRLTARGVTSKRLTVWPAGTLLFSMYASLGHTTELRVAAATNQAILALLPKKNVSQSFLKRWFEYLRPSLREHASSNTQDNLNAEKVRNLLAMLPPLPEQRTIAAFLDHETAKIDALIEEAKKAIELMKERRTALISAAVTGKIDVRGYCPA